MHDVVAPHALTQTLHRCCKSPHSRWNEVRRGRALSARLSGPDAFARSRRRPVRQARRSLLVFFQGHPEYDPHSLSREYRRDVAALPGGASSDDYPGLPEDYFDARHEAALEAFRARALADRSGGEPARPAAPARAAAGVAEGWQGTVVPVFRNWLALLAQARH